MNGFPKEIHYKSNHIGTFCESLGGLEKPEESLNLAGEFLVLPYFFFCFQKQRLPFLSY